MDGWLLEPLANLLPPLEVGLMSIELLDHESLNLVASSIKYAKLQLMGICYMGFNSIHEFELHSPNGEKGMKYE